MERHPLAGKQADRRRAPEGRRCVEAAHVEALLEDDARAEKPDAGHDLGRNPRRAVRIRDRAAIGDEDRRPERDQRIGPQAREMLAPLAFKADRRAEAGGDEEIQSGLRERDGHAAPSDADGRYSLFGKGNASIRHEPFTPNSDDKTIIRGVLGNLEETMVLRILSRGAIAAFAGAAMLAGSTRILACLHPFLAFARAACRRRGHPVRLVAWRLAWWVARRLASRMGLARRLASGWGWGGGWHRWGRLGSALWLRARLALLVGPVGPPLRRSDAPSGDKRRRQAALALHLLQ